MRTFRPLFTLVVLVFSLAQPMGANAQLVLDAEITRLAQAETPAVLDTLKRLTSVDTGTTQAPGLLAVADMIEAFVKPLGAEVRRVAPAAKVPGPVSITQPLRPDFLQDRRRNLFDRLGGG